ncbi:hypothetical protein JL193_00090 [Polaribacter batillariae]|uniref:Uncharacterized protein n=1 Tax=Polaribacter batillariae TaxID=2808900 RepID=A0ABX7SUA9_9FLAO|nr:hypothetical protein [Polaribacter batillariae]QTD37751.1 hypothetical protein JL193_00090 [Polaribacter batillariae]
MVSFVGKNQILYLDSRFQGNDNYNGNPNKKSPCFIVNVIQKLIKLCRYPNA